MGSDSIVLKEVHIRISGTVSNQNYGNLSPDVKLVFSAEGLENWSEGLQQMVNTTHEAFIDAAATMLAGFNGRRYSDDMLRELGVRTAASIVPMGDDGEYTLHFADDDIDEEDSDGDAALEDDFDGEPDDDDQDWMNDTEAEDEEDTREVDTSHLTGGTTV